MKRAILILLLTAATSAAATIIVSESFVYNASTLTGQAGGYGWGGPWRRAEASYSSLGFGNGLTYTGVAASGSSARANGNRILANARPLAADSSSYGNVVWVRFIGALWSAGAGAPTLRFYDNGALTGGIGGAAGYNAWNLLDASLTNRSGAWATSTPLNGTTHLALLRIDYEANTSSMWMDPVLSTFDGTQPVSLQVSFAPVFDEIRIYSRKSRFDEILITAEDKVHTPEPSGFALAGSVLLISAIGLLRRQKRLQRK